MPLVYRFDGEVIEREASPRAVGSRKNNSHKKSRYRAEFHCVTWEVCKDFFVYFCTDVH